MRWFSDYEALAAANAALWQTHQQRVELSLGWPMWERWIEDYRQIVQQAQEIAEAYDWRDPPP